MNVAQLVIHDCRRFLGDTAAQWQLRDAYERCLAVARLLRREYQQSFGYGCVLTQIYNCVYVSNAHSLLRHVVTGGY